MSEGRGSLKACLLQVRPLKTEGFGWVGGFPTSTARQNHLVAVTTTDAALAGVAQQVGVPSHVPKGCWFDSQSGHMPGLWFSPHM